MPRKYPHDYCTACGAGKFVSRNKLFEHLRACTQVTAELQEGHYARMCAARHLHEQLELRETETSPAIHRVDLFPDGSAFILENLLTPDECRAFIEAGEAAGFSDCGHDVDMISVRVTDRVFIPSPQLARALFQRIRPHLSGAVDLSGTMEALPQGLREDLLPGEWIPCGLNSLLRMCRYQPGGFFLPHRDGAFDDDDGIRYSLQTWMLYLNGDFDGGETVFYNDRQTIYRKGEEENITYKYKPNAGSVIIFNQNMKHDGQQVCNGQKYIMRSEVMFRER